MMKKCIAVVLTAVLCITTLSACGSKKPMNNEIITYSDGVTQTVKKPTIKSNPCNNAEVSLLNEYLTTFCNDYYVCFSNEFERGKNNYLPVPVKLSWEDENNAENYKITISKDKNFTESDTYTSNGTEFEIYDLYANTHYYYYVEAFLGDKTVKSRTFDFTTSYLPRTISIDNVYNTRDIGGLKTRGGKTIKQGMIYRGAKLDDITRQGKDKALNTYRIKTDLDLRVAGEGSAGRGSPLGETVNYYNKSCPYYVGGSSGIRNGDLNDNLRDAIKLFADESNYPFYVHCSIGRDRTGTICFLLNAMLGASEKDLYREYELSFFSSAGVADGQTPKAMVDDMFGALIKFITFSNVNASLQENAENFILGIGVTKQEIESIKKIMLQ